MTRPPLAHPDRGYPSEAHRAAAMTVRARTEAGLAWARAWRLRRKPHFDALEAAGAFAPERFA